MDHDRHHKCDLIPYFEQKWSHNESLNFIEYYEKWTRIKYIYIAMGSRRRLENTPVSRHVCGALLWERNSKYISIKNEK